MSREKVRRGLVTIAAIVVLIAGMRAAASIVVPILLALFLAFVSSPLVFRLSKTRMPYPLAVSLVLLLELAVLGTLGVLIGSSVGRFEQRVPVYRDRLGEIYRELADFMSSHGVRLAPEGLSTALDPGAIMEMIGTTLTGLGAILGNLLLVVLVLAFTLFDASRLWRKVEAHFAGSAAGDHVLTVVASTLSGNLRPTDLVARFGGEEFVIIFPDTDVELAQVAAERVREAISKEKLAMPDGTELPSVTISMGVSQLADGQSVPELLKVADMAMYRAKQAGRNRVMVGAASDLEGA